VTVPTEHDVTPRPPSPWTGSQHRTRHRWQLDLVSSLAEAAKDLQELAGELTAADMAGWWLVEPMHAGHLLAARASRRQRARRAPISSPPIRGTAAPAPRWRLRVINEWPLAGEESLDAAAATTTSVLVWTGRSLEQVCGPGVPAEVLDETARQVAPTGLARRRWCLVAARVGPAFDLVADGSALRLHAVHEGALVRTQEVLTCQHAADGAGTLLEAGTAYERLARATVTMAASGGRLVSADDGFLHVYYDRLVA